MNRNQIKLITCLVMITIILFSTCLSIGAEEKIYFTGTLDDITSENEIIVTIFHEYSGLDKTYSFDDFPGIEIDEIKYLTSLKDPDKDYPMLNLDSYCQILSIKISNPGKENVLNAIKILEENPIVYSAFPNSNASTDNIRIGDINKDNKLNAADALMALQHSSQIISLNYEEIIRGDTNSDGIVNSVDALSILKIAAGLPVW